MTCALVTTWPCASTRNPEPSACCFMTWSPLLASLGAVGPAGALRALVEERKEVSHVGHVREAKLAPRHLTSCTVVMLTTRRPHLGDERRDVRRARQHRAGWRTGRASGARRSGGAAATAECWQPVPSTRARAVNGDEFSESCHGLKNNTDAPPAFPAENANRDGGLECPESVIETNPASGSSFRRRPRPGAPLRPARPLARPRPPRPRSPGPRSATASAALLDRDVAAERHELAVEALRVGRVAGGDSPRLGHGRDRSPAPCLRTRSSTSRSTASRPFSSAAARTRSGPSAARTDGEHEEEQAEKTSGTTPRAMGVPGSGIGCGTRSNRCATRSSVIPFSMAQSPISRLNALRPAMTKFAPPELPVSGGSGFDPRPRRRGLGAVGAARGRLPDRGEAVEDAAVLADAHVALVVEHQPRHHRVGLLARQAGHAHHVGQADAALAGADRGDDVALGLARVLRRRSRPEEEAVHALVERHLRLARAGCVAARRPGVPGAVPRRAGISVHGERRPRVERPEERVADHAQEHVAEGAAGQAAAPARVVALPRERHRDDEREEDRGVAHEDDRDPRAHDEAHGTREGVPDGPEHPAARVARPPTAWRTRTGRRARARPRP